MPDDFPAALPPDFPSELATAPTMKIAAGEPVFHQGDSCDNYVVVVSGAVKIFARSAAGKEIVLYRVGAGEVCVLTTSCLLAHKRYPAEAIAETDLVLKVLPRQRFELLLDTSKSFRKFVFASFSARLANLIAVVQQVALESVEERLVKYLLIHCDKNNKVSATHQAVATEIGSAREVVSRQLKALERQGWLQIERGVITLCDKAALQRSLSRF